MTKFTYDDIVRVKAGAPEYARPSEPAWIVDVVEDRQKTPLDHLPAGVVYTIEFEDGHSLDIHEDHLKMIKARSEE